jgi:hypothetical protein
LFSDDEPSYVRPTFEGTGSHAANRHKMLSYPFGRFEILVELTEDNQFVGISEVRLRKDFRTPAQKLLSSKGDHDVEEFYQE